jgi:hypothetical protein
VVGVSSWRAGRAGEDGGVKVERPEPRARTYDLDATVGRRRLVVDDIDRVVGPAVTPGSHRALKRWLRCGSRCAEASLRSVRQSGAHDAIVATTAVGLNQFNDLATGVGVMPIVELAIVVVSEPVMPPPRVG